MQFYHHPSLKTGIIQIRSGHLPGQGKHFIKDLLAWCKEVHITRVVGLTSSFAHERNDKQLTGSCFRYIKICQLQMSILYRYMATSGIDLGTEFTRLEERKTYPGLQPDEEAPDAFFLPGSGVAKNLISMCQESQIEGVVLSKFCEEGDNSTDGIQLADHLNKWASWVEGEKYKVPPSWDHLFGPPAPVEMYW